MIDKKLILSSVYSALLEELDINIKNKNSDDIFKEKPVTFREFAASPEHMNFPTLTERQLRVADFMLGNDIYKMFDNKNCLAVLKWSKGSGKDTIAVLIILYIVYFLLCLKNPQKYFGLHDTDSIDLVNCAASGEQAANVFFEKFRQKILSWKWLTDRYTIRISGTYIKQADAKSSDNSVLITKNGVIFPKLIRAFSGHSRETSIEGLNLLCGVLDEASAFVDGSDMNNADKILNSMRSSAASRFGTRWKAFVISYPRYKDDIICRLYEISKRELHMYGDTGATWEIKPRYLFSEKTFEFEGYQIPIDFEQEFKLNPEDAKCKYLSIPPDVVNSFIEYPEKINECIDFSRSPIINIRDIIKDKVEKEIINFNLPIHQPNYVMTIDLGLKSDSAAMSIFHKEFNGQTEFIVQDFVTAWNPIPHENKTVSFLNIRDFIASLRNKVNITQIQFDQWNSQYLVEELRNLGFNSDVYSLKFQDYKNLKERIYNKSIKLLNYPDQIKELRKLQLLKNGKIDHPEGGKKDLADTIVGACKILDEKISYKNSAFMDGEFIVPNLEEHGEFI